METHLHNPTTMHNHKRRFLLMEFQQLNHFPTLQCPNTPLCKLPVPDPCRKVHVPTSTAPVGMYSSISHWPHPTQYKHHMTSHDHQLPEAWPFTSLQKLPPKSLSNNIVFVTKNYLRITCYKSNNYDIHNNNYLK